MKPRIDPQHSRLLTLNSDWERVVVIWSKSSDGNWRQSKLFLSQHSGYDKQAWSDVQNTFNDADASLPRGGDNGRTNLDHPKVYVAWGKHANYEDRNTVSRTSRACDLFSSVTRN